MLIRLNMNSIIGNVNTLYGVINLNFLIILVSLRFLRR